MRVLVLLSQVCDSDTVLDPACTIEMLKIFEEDPMVGGVGGDVQVWWSHENSGESQLKVSTDVEKNTEDAVFAFLLTGFSE